MHDAFRPIAREQEYLMDFEFRCSGIYWIASVTNGICCNVNFEDPGTGVTYVAGEIGIEQEQHAAWQYAAAWLAQLVERQSAVREVEGSSHRPDQHSGS